MKRGFLFWSVVAVVIAAVARPTPARAQAYEITTDIPSLSANPQMYVGAMNNAGQVTGWGYDSQGYQRAFLFDGTNTVDLGTLGGLYSSGLRINAGGQVIGWAYTVNNNQQAFLYQGNALIPIAFSATSYSYPTGINSAGAVIGYGNRPGYGQRAFVYTGGAIIDLNDVTVASGWLLQNAIDINDNGQILVHGYNSTAGQWRSAVLTPSGGTYTFTDLGSLGGTYTYGQDINASGQVAGYSSLANGNQRAFLYSPGIGITDLGTFGGDYSSAVALNDAGQVAGWAYDAGNSQQHGFLYSSGSKQDLGAGRYPRAINAAGLILGDNFLYSNGAVRDLQGVVGRCRSNYYYYYNYNAINDSGQIAFGASYYYSNTLAFIASPIETATASFDVGGAGAVYNGSVYLWARLWGGCSWLPGKQLAFSLNGSAVGTVTTDQYGQAILPSASAAGIEPGYYPQGVGVSFAGDADATAAAGTAELWIYKRNPVLSWSPASLVQGTPLGAAQLNAVADTPGTFFYSPSAGTLLPAGLNYLYATFQPSDSAHYEYGYAQAAVAVRAQSPAMLFDAAEIPGLGGTWLDVRDLNDSGVVTGVSNTAANTNHAFIYANGVTTDLGTLGGSNGYSEARAINASGQVTGYSYNTNNRWRAYLYSNGVMTDLGALSNSSDYSQGEDLNDSGHVVGWSYNSSGYQRAFRSIGGSMTDLGVLPGGRWSTARFINNAGQIAGTSETCAPTCATHAFLFDQGTMIDLGTLGGTYSEATAMNASGHVVGSANLTDNSTQHAFVYRDGAILDLGTLGGSWSVAYGINDAGEVTGWSYTTGNQAVHAFKYSNGAMTDLGSLSSGSSYSQAYKINGVSQVVGYSQNAQGQQVGFIHASGAMHDLNALVDSNQIGAIQYAQLLNDPGQIAGTSYWNGQQRAFLLTPKTLQPSSLAAAPASGPSAGSATLSATLSSDGSPLGGQTVFFRINGTPAGSAVTSASGVATLSGVSLVGIQPGTYGSGVAATFPGAPGIGGSTATAALHVNNLPTVIWSNPAAIVYGTPLSATQLNATASVPGTFTYTPAAGTLLNVGNNQTLSVSFTPTDASYSSVAVTTVSINVSKATPNVFWSNPAGIAFGTALGAAQLNATASVPGAFTYTPSAGTLLNVGNNQVLSVSFIPTDTSNYNGVPVTTVSINVTKATPTVTWNNPSAIVYGTPLGAAQLNASANVAGQFIYTPDAGTVLNAGAGQTLSVTFTPTDTANYNGASKSVALTVNRAPLTITADNKSVVLNGVVPALTATYSGFVNGDTTTSLAPGASLATAATGAAVGAFAITAAGAVHPNYNINHVPGTLTVSYATGMCLGDVGRQVLNPLNADGSSVVKRNSTVPVKFRVCDANGNSIGSPGVVSSFVMIQALSGTISADLEAIEATTPDSAFRWDASGQQWIFNMSTKNQSANRTYVYRITLSDHSTIEFRYGVR